ncbi:MAG: hypothetical protein ACU0CA_10735 [Paracoccaceae bacterium]
MPNPNLMAVITALIFFAGTGGAKASYNLGQLQQIEQFILSKDCGALLGYLQLNPAIMDGDDQLALELRSFADGVEGGLIQCLSASTVSEVPVPRPGTVAGSNSGTGSGLGPNPAVSLSRIY